MQVLADIPAYSAASAPRAAAPGDAPVSTSRPTRLMDLPADVLLGILRQADCSTRLTCRTLRTLHDMAAPPSTRLYHLPPELLAAILRRVVAPEHCLRVPQEHHDKSCFVRLTSRRFRAAHDAIVTSLKHTWFGHERPHRRVASRELRAMLARVPNLTHLYLSNIASVDVSPLAVCTQLVRLDLSRRSRLTDIKPLGACVRLECLNLANCVNLSKISALASCTRLQQLYLEDTQVRDVGALASCTLLHTLQLMRCCQLSNVRALAACVELKVLGLHGCVGISDVVPLASCVKLMSLNVTGSGVKDLSPLAACTALQTLLVDPGVRLGGAPPNVRRFSDRRHSDACERSLFQQTSL